MPDFLFQVLRLFDKTLRTIATQPLLAFMLCVQLFLVLVGLFGWLFRLGKKGKL